MNEFASAVPGPRVRSAILLGGLACAAAVLSLLGWILDLPRLAAWEGTIAMQPNTAIAGAAAGLALVLLAVHRRRGAIIAGGFAAVLGGLSLVQNLAGFDLGTDALVSFERPWGEDGTVAPGSRMSPPAALSWVLLGTGIVLGALPARAARRAAPWLALGAVAIASLSIVGRLFGADPLFAMPRLTAISLQTAAISLAIALGTIAALPEQLPMRILRSRGAAGLIARCTLPIVVAVPLVISWLRLSGQDAGLYDTRFAIALRTVCEVAMLSAGLWWALHRVDRYEAELAGSETFNRRLLESSRDCISVLDLDGNLLSANEACRELYEATGSSIARNRPWAEFWQGADGAAAGAVLRAARGEVQRFQTDLVLADGTKRWWDITVVPVRDAQGRPERLLATSRDVTSEKVAKEALERREAELRRQTRQLTAFLETAPVCLHRLAPDGTVTWANETALTTFGHGPQDYAGRDFGEFLVDEESACDTMARLRRGEALRAHELRMRCKDGAVKWVLLDSTSLHEDGRLLHTHCFTRDVTEQKRIDATRAALAAIVATSDDAIISKTLDGRIQSWNQGAERLFGYTAAEAVGRSIELIIPPELRHEEHEILARLRDGQRVAHYETVRVAKSGARVDISLSVSPLRDHRGRITGASKVARDITEKKRAEAELREHREHLERLVEERTAALQRSHQRLRAAERLASLGTLSAGLGHDMGNLLVPVRVRLESLGAIPLPPGAEDDVRAIRTSTEYLQRLANGLRLLALDPSARPVRETSELSAWWSDAQGVMRTVLPRAVVLAADLPEECAVRISRAALTQAVFNLVQNSGDALRERGHGRVVVAARVDGDTVHLSVTDDGPGMTPEVRRQCMDPFFSTKTRGISTGLGLALVYGLVREAGGAVELHSEVGVGTTFTLALPRAEASAAADRAHGGRAHVALRDARLRSFATGELLALGYRVEGPSVAGVADLMVLDRASDLETVPACAAILFLGDGVPPDARVRVLDARPTFAALRAALRRISAEQFPAQVGSAAGKGEPS